MDISVSTSSKSTDLEVNQKQKSLKTQKFQKYCGDKNFVKLFFRLFIPSAAQNLAVIFVLFINNFYLAQFCNNGAAAKTGVGLADPIVTFTVLVMLAWLGGVSVMMSQYFGNKDYYKNQQIIIYAFISTTFLMLPFIILLGVIPEQLMHITSGAEISHADTATINYGRIYLQQISWTFVPLIFSEVLSIGLQNTKKAGISLCGALISAAISIIFDPIAIILTEKHPENSVQWVAIIDGIARVAQLAFLLVYIAIKKYQPVYIYKKIIVSKEVWTRTLKFGLPSFVNDGLFAFFLILQNISILNYSSHVTAVNNILGDGSQFGNIQESTTNVTLILQFANVIWPGMAAATAVLVGSYLGKGDIEEAKANARRSLLWGFLISCLIISLLFGLSWFINDALNKDVAHWKNILAMHMEWVMLPIILSQGIFSILYFSVRCGGTKLVVLCDSVIMGIWTIIMTALTLTNKLNYINPVAYLFMIQCEQLLRMVMSALVFRFTKWARTLTVSSQPNQQAANEVQENIFG